MHFVLTHLTVTPWTVAHQTPLSMGFSHQEYWCGLFPRAVGGSRSASPELVIDCL